VWIDEDLLDQLRQRFPETKGLTYSGTVDVCLRKLLTRGSE